MAPRSFIEVVYPCKLTFKTTQLTPQIQILAEVLAAEQLR